MFPSEPISTKWVAFIQLLHKDLQNATGQNIEPDAPLISLGSFRLAAQDIKNVSIFSCHPKRCVFNMFNFIFAAFLKTVIQAVLNKGKGKENIF